MYRAKRAKLRPASPQLSSPDSPTSASAGPPGNALKHGLRSGLLLLPGDDAAEFEARRCEALHTHRPRTQAELRCVDAMVRLEWRMERCERWQEIYDAKHEAVVGERAAPDGPHCEADPHRWMHRAMDCQLQSQRMERQMARTLRRLEELQKLRRQNLLARVAAEDVEPAEELAASVEGDAAAEAVDRTRPEAQPTGAQAAPERIARDQPRVTPTSSPHGRNGLRDKRTAPRPPMHGGALKAGQG